MPTIARLPSTLSRMYRPLTLRPPRRCLLPVTSVRQPGVQARLQSGPGKEWKGAEGEKHTIHRVKKEGDATDPQTIGAARTMKDREESYGVGHSDKSSAATERGGREEERKAKKDHPKAPEPVIGMNDERGRKA